MVISRDVVFEEDEKWNWSMNGENSHSLTFLPNFLPDQTHEEESQPSDEEEEASAEVTSSSQTLGDIHSPRYKSLTDLYSETSPITQDEEAHLLSGEEPLSYSEAANEEVWIRAMREEMLSIDRNDTWELEIPPTKLQTDRIEVDLQIEEESTERCHQAQGQVSSERLFSEKRGRLLRSLCSCCAV